MDINDRFNVFAYPVKKKLNETNKNGIEIELARIFMQMKLLLMYQSWKKSFFFVVFGVKSANEKWWHGASAIKLICIWIVLDAGAGKHKHQHFDRVNLGDEQITTNSKN